MKVLITRTYSPSAGVTLEAGEHELTDHEIQRAKRFGVVGEKPKPSKSKATEPPRNK